MGIILDSSVIIDGERRGRSVRQILEQIRAAHGETQLGLSVITLVELMHGVQRAGEEERRRRRQAFVDELERDLPVYAITAKTARLAGKIAGEQASGGHKIALEDLLIATTALELGFGVATGNVRHFQMVPGLTVVRA